jgi:hypothetical protein
MQLCDLLTSSGSPCCFFDYPVRIHGSLVVTVFLGTTRRNLRENQQKSFATHSTRWLLCTSVECAGNLIHFGRKSMYVSQQILTFRDR